MIYVREHPESGYRARTEFNAKNSALTIAFAKNFNTAGERLTRQAAAGRYVAVDLGLPSSDMVTIINEAFEKFNIGEDSVVNIAGHGLPTLAEYGFDQARVNQVVSIVFRGVFLKHRVKGFRSGGQTGVDLAGAVTARVLGKDAVITMPKGYLQRDVAGKDAEHSKSDIENMIEGCARPMIAMPRVWHKDDPKCPSDAEYIGRPGGKAEGWGNPFKVDVDGTREQVIEKYRLWLYNQPDMIALAKMTLCGKHLACHCKPKACHGDVLLEVANHPYM